METPSYMMPRILHSGVGLFSALDDIPGSKKLDKIPWSFMDSLKHGTLNTALAAQVVANVILNGKSYTAGNHKWSIPGVGIINCTPASSGLIGDHDQCNVHPIYSSPRIIQEFIRKLQRLLLEMNENVLGHFEFTFYTYIPQQGMIKHEKNELNAQHITPYFSHGALQWFQKNMVVNVSLQALRNENH